MGRPKESDPVLVVLAAFSRHPEALDWARDRVIQVWGPICRTSPYFAFDATDYYEPTMGPGIIKVFHALERLRDPGELPSWKLLTQEWEAEYAKMAGHPEPRPLNLDPGYLTNAKLVLASTKDHAHRIYLNRGIYAEVTLYFRDGDWRAREWTFADYRRPDYHAYFTDCRDEYRRLLRSMSDHPKTA
jgi:hypothetical protein